MGPVGPGMGDGVGVGVGEGDGLLSPTIPVPKTTPNTIAVIINNMINIMNPPISIFVPVPILIKINYFFSLWLINI
jgi:hypothetical protein